MIKTTTNRVKYLSQVKEIMQDANMTDHEIVVAFGDTLAYRFAELKDALTDMWKAITGK